MCGEPAAGEPLSPETENLLGGVPEFIGDLSDDAPGDSAAPIDADPVAALMAAVAFEEQDVKDTLCEFFDWLAEKYKSDHWKLTDRHARMLGRPATQLANAMWAKLQTILPDVLGRWCETTPGALGFLTACGLVVAPKIMQQMKISRDRKAANPMVRPGQSHGPMPKPQTAAGMIYKEGSAQ